MANKQLFDYVEHNESGGIAYRMKPEAALAQYSVTSCLNQTFYASAETQLKMILNLCPQVDPEFVAKTAVYARERAYMKDVPVLLCAWLSAKHVHLLSRVFDRVINNGKALRNFVQIIRSGATGRKSFGSVLKRHIANWFNARTTKEVFLQSGGESPSFSDILRMTHPKPLDKTKNALYRWLLGLECDNDYLLEQIRQYNLFKNGNVSELPDVPIDMLTALKLSQSDWCQIAMRAHWNWLRMNLNTLQRHGAFEAEDIVDIVATRLADKDLIRKSHVFPYQLLNAYKNTTDVPYKIREAIHDAMEIATSLVPGMHGNGYVAMDVSGSMASAITGSRVGSTSKVRCVDVAGLIASIILRKNPSSIILPFANEVRGHDINSRDTVITNAKKLGDMLGGGTNCSAPLCLLNERNAIGNWVYLISDNQSWMDSLPGRERKQNKYYNNGPGHTEFMRQWDIFKRRNPNAVLVCLDIQPYSTSQAQERKDILNIGGFSDNVFNVVDLFLRNELSADHWINVIRDVEI